VLVAGGGGGEVAQVVLGVSQAVPGMPLEPAVADFRAQVECPAAGQAGLMVVTQKPVIPADVVERFGLGGLVAGGLEQAQCLLGVPERVGVAA
jgi:hypothetical protein